MDEPAVTELPMTVKQIWTGVYEHLFTKNTATYGFTEQQVVDP